MSGTMIAGKMIEVEIVEEFAGAKTIEMTGTTMIVGTIVEGAEMLTAEMTLMIAETIVEVAEMTGARTMIGIMMIVGVVVAESARMVAEPALGFSAGHVRDFTRIDRIDAIVTADILLVQTGNVI